VIETIKCHEDRFGKDTVGKGTNLTKSFCPKEVNFPIAGNAATRKMLTF
jgi:hypothetical protein